MQELDATLVPLLAVVRPSSVARPEDPGEGFVPDFLETPNPAGRQAQDRPRCRLVSSLLAPPPRLPELAVLVSSTEIGRHRLGPVGRRRLPMRDRGEVDLSGSPQSRPAKWKKTASKQRPSPSTRRSAFHHPPLRCAQRVLGTVPYLVGRPPDPAEQALGLVRT